MLDLTRTRSGDHRKNVVTYRTPATPRNRPCEEAMSTNDVTGASRAAFGGQDSADSDEALVDRARARDGSAFELLMRRHNQRVYRVVRAVLRDDDEIEDVIQQAYMQA